VQSFMMEVTQEKELDKKLSNAEGILQRAAAKAGIMQHSSDLQLIETNVQTLARCTLQRGCIRGAIMGG